MDSRRLGLTAAKQRQRFDLVGLRHHVDGHDAVDRPTASAEDAEVAAKAAIEDRMREARDTELQAQEAGSATQKALQGKIEKLMSTPPAAQEAVAMRESNTHNYVQDQGDGLRRRSMYTFWKRSAPPASMEIFDAPSRETCAVRRERTNTPLQALTLLNDHAYVEMALAFANRIVSEPGLATDEQRIRFAFRVALSREAKPVEVGYLKSLLAKRDAELANAPKTAEFAAGRGHTPTAPDSTDGGGGAAETTVPRDRAVPR